MTTYFLTITSSVLLELFYSDIFEIFAIIFLFATGLSLLQLIKYAV